MPKEQAAQTTHRRDRSRANAAASRTVEPAELETLLDQDEAAALLGLSPRTLEGRRARGEPPGFVKFGNSRTARVKYRPSVLARFVAESERAAGPDEPEETR